MKKWPTVSGNVTDRKCFYHQCYFWHQLYMSRCQSSTILSTEFLCNVISEIHLHLRAMLAYVLNQRSYHAGMGKKFTNFAQRN